jgi:hypothetical protein
MSQIITKQQILSVYATRAAQNEIVIRTHCPVLRVEVVRFPRLVLDASGRAVESGDFFEREVTVRDRRWFDRTPTVVIAQAYADAAQVLIAGEEASAVLPQNDEVLRRLVYSEDQQMYSRVPFVFETDCPWTLERLSKLSWEVEFPGSSGASFETFQSLLFCCGFKCKLVDRMNENDKPPSGFGIVEGATGSY